MLRFPPITQESFAACRNDSGTHRICFASTHASQPRRDETSWEVGHLHLPFGHGVAMIFQANCPFRKEPQRNANGSVRWSLVSDDDFDTVRRWTKAQGTRVFLRDCLDATVALDVNLRDGEGRPDGHTEIGTLERRAKQGNDPDAVRQLVEGFAATVRGLHYFKVVRMVAGVPAPPGKPFHLPTALAAGVAAALGIEDISPRFAFTGTKTSIKATRLEEKWRAWEQTGLSVTPELKLRPPVLLVDDKYQSGTTLNFVASRLRAAGAGAIYGLCAVKTWRDTDNA